MSNERVAKAGMNLERQILQSRGLGFAFLILVFPFERKDLDTQIRNTCESARQGGMSYRIEGWGCLKHLLGCVIKRLVGLHAEMER